MTVVNFKIHKISGERKDKTGIKNVTANANSTIVSINKEKDKSIGEYLLVNFKYAVKYEPDIGSLSLEGSLWYLHPNLKDVISESKDKIGLKRDAIAEISTVIIRDSLLESVDLARRLQLPPPIQLPKVEVKSDELKFRKAS
jgi:hypothetical protein